MFLDPARVVHREEQLLVINLRGLPLETPEVVGRRL